MQLLGLDGPSEGKTYPLDAPEVTVGRVRPGPERAVGWVFLPDQTVSGTHAKLSWNDARQTYTLSNHSKTNPTTLNGVALDMADLQPGDRLRMGQCTLQFQNAALAAPPPSRAQLLPLCVEVVAGPDQGKRHSLSGTVLSLGGQRAATSAEEPWFDQELIFSDPNLGARCLQWNWQEARRGFAIRLRPGHDSLVLVRRTMDELDWTASLGAGATGWLEANDIVQMGSTAIKLVALEEQP